MFIKRRRVIWMAEDEVQKTFQLLLVSVAKQSYENVSSVKRFPGLLAERMIVLAVLPHKLRSMFDGHAMVVPQIVQPLLFSGKDADQKECWTVHLSEDVNFLGSLQSQEDVCGSFHRFR